MPLFVQNAHRHRKTLIERHSARMTVILSLVPERRPPLCRKTKMIFGLKVKKKKKKVNTDLVLANKGAVGKAWKINMPTHTHRFTILVVCTLDNRVISLSYHSWWDKPLSNSHMVTIGRLLILSFKCSGHHSVSVCCSVGHIKMVIVCCLWMCNSTDPQHNPSYLFLTECEVPSEACPLFEEEEELDDQPAVRTRTIPNNKRYETVCEMMLTLWVSGEITAADYIFHW